MNKYQTAVIHFKPQFLIFHSHRFFQMSIDCIISVACAKHLAVWSIVAPRLIEHIDAKKYIVIVPEVDVDCFRKISPKSLEVISEDDVLPGVKEKISNKLKGTSAVGRAGWYLQQLLKIEACRSGRWGNERLLIWDADTVPLRKLNFYDASLRPIFYRGSEFHPPYFDCLKALTGLDRQVQFSFVAQCFPLNRKWLLEFIGTIERRTDMSWVDAIIQTLNPDTPSSFSEYETLGNFFARHHRSEMFCRRSRWFRNGNALLGGVGRAHPDELERLSVFYDFVSFETWDTAPIKWKKRLFLRLGVFPSIMRLLRYREASPEQL